MAGKVELLGPLYGKSYGSDTLGITKPDGPTGGKSPKDPLDLIKTNGVSKSTEQRSPLISKE